MEQCRQDNSYINRSQKLNNIPCFVFIKYYSVHKVIIEGFEYKREKENTITSMNCKNHRQILGDLFKKTTIIFMTQFYKKGV